MIRRSEMAKELMHAPIVLAGKSERMEGILYEN